MKHLVLVTLFFLSACNITDTNSDKIISLYNSISPSKLINGNKAILVIPMVGCGSCADMAIKFIKDNIDSSEKLFCIISSSGEKRAKIKLKGFTHNKVLIDSKSKAILESLVLNFPTIYYFEKNKTRIKQLDGNNQFEEIKLLKATLSEWKNE